MLTAKGYVRLKSGPNRDRYEHSVVMGEMCKELCFYPIDWLGMPKWPGVKFTVEHMDHNRTHNHRGNLMLLDKRIHDHLSWQSWTEKETING